MWEISSPDPARCRLVACCPGDSARGSRAHSPGRGVHSEAHAAGSEPGRIAEAGQASGRARFGQQTLQLPLEPCRDRVAILGSDAAQHKALDVDGDVSHGHLHARWPPRLTTNSARRAPRRMS